MITVRNLQYFRSLDTKKLPPDFGARLNETLSDIIKAAGNIETQTNTNGSGTPVPPPPLSAINVAGQDGIYHVSLTHNADIYRGVNYHIEYSADAHFTDGGFPIDPGTSREWRGALGAGPFYFRAAASNGISAPSDWLYFGGATPTAVSGGGSSGPSLPSQSQGSGTGYAGQGLQGPGQYPFRSATGVPPVR